MFDQTEKAVGAANAPKTVGLSLRVVRFALRDQHRIKIETKELRGLIARGVLPAVFVEGQGYQVAPEHMPRIVALFRDAATPHLAA